MPVPIQISSIWEQYFWACPSIAVCTWNGLQSRPRNWNSVIWHACSTPWIFYGDHPKLPSIPVLCIASYYMRPFLYKFPPLGEQNIWVYPHVAVCTWNGLQSRPRNWNSVIPTCVRNTTDMKKKAERSPV